MKFVGVISGTSVDGLDVALVEVPARGRPTLIAAATTPLPATLAADLRALAQPGADDGVDRVGAADAVLGVFIGETVCKNLAEWGVAPREVRAIGSHGQTIRHRPAGSRPEGFTVQVGDPNRIAEFTGIDTVADFRRRDMAAGGEGAPLAPLFHQTLFRATAAHHFVVNIGGIANVTVLPAGSEEVSGFDTGPGNALLDAWIRECRGEDFDRDGAWGAGGTVVPELLAALQSDPFLGRAPPKSTGKETYHLGYVQAACAGLTPPARDVQATLAEFTARSVADAIERWGPGGGDVLLCGGGRRNGDLVRRLIARLPDCRVTTTDATGFDGDALEAAAFAWLAHRALARLSGNAPKVTGADGARVLGAIYPGGNLP